MVSAASVQEDGDLEHYPDTTVVQDDGRYLLRIDDANDVDRYVLVEATTDSTSTSVILFRPSSAEASIAAPMSDESDAEADVFLVSRADVPELTFPRIAAFVNTAVAAEVQDGTVSAGDLANLIVEGQSAEEEYVDDSDAVDAKRDTDEAAYLDFQVAIDAATTATAEQEAKDEYDDAVASGYVEGGANVSVNAKAAEAGRSAMAEFVADASVSPAVANEALIRADLFVGKAVAGAVRAQLVAADASDSVLAAVDASAEALLSGIENATLSTQVDAEFDAYVASVSTHLATTIGVSETVVQSARVATDVARAALDTAVGAAATAEEIAIAHREYFVAAEAAAETALATSTDAENGAEIVALMSLR